MQRLSGGKRERWLLIKMDDEKADARRNPVSSEPESVFSGRAVEDLGAEAETETEAEPEPEPEPEHGRSRRRGR